MLAERPLGDVTDLPNGLRIAPAGVLRIATTSGKATVTSPTPLPTIEGVEAVTRWLVDSTAPGVATLPLPDSQQTITYVRTTEPVTITR